MQSGVDGSLYSSYRMLIGRTDHSSCVTTKHPWDEHAGHYDSRSSFFFTNSAGEWPFRTQHIRVIIARGLECLGG